MPLASASRAERPKVSIEQGATARSAAASRVGQPVAVLLERQPEDALAAGAPLEPPARRPIADEHEPRAGAPLDLGPRGEQQVDLLLAGQPPDVDRERALRQAVAPAGLGGLRASRGMESLEVDAERHADDPLDADPLELPRHEVRGRERRPHHPAQPADVPPGELRRLAAHRPAGSGHGAMTRGKLLW